MIERRNDSDESFKYVRVQFVKFNKDRGRSLIFGVAIAVAAPAQAVERDLYLMR